MLVFQKVPHHSIGYESSVIWQASCSWLIWSWPGQAHQEFFGWFQKIASRDCCSSFFLCFFPYVSLYSLSFWGSQSGDINALIHLSAEFFRSILVHHAWLINNTPDLPQMFWGLDRWPLNYDVWHHQSPDAQISRIVSVGVLFLQDCSGRTCGMQKIHRTPLVRLLEVCCVVMLSNALSVIHNGLCHV